MINLFKLFIATLIGIFLLTVGPWCFIWAINTLISAGGITTFAIPFTLKTWLAAVIIGGLSVLPGIRRKQ